MKKIILTVISVLIVFMCSSCTINLTVNTDKETEKSEAVSSASDAFYGVWCSGGKNKSDAEKIAKELSGKGFDAQIFVTTDWQELNPEMFYVVTAGVCETQEEADKLLVSVKKEGYSDAYIKYTGKRK